MKQRKFVGVHGRPLTSLFAKVCFQETDDVQVIVLQYWLETALCGVGLKAPYELVAYPLCNSLVCILNRLLMTPQFSSVQLVGCRF